MTTKEVVLKTIEQLPEGVSWEDIQDRIDFVLGVREGLRQIDEGQEISHDEIGEEFGQWHSN